MEIAYPFLVQVICLLLNCRVKGALSASGITAKGMKERCLGGHMALHLLLAKRAR